MRETRSLNCSVSFKMRISSGISSPTSVPTTTTTLYRAKRKLAPSLNVKKRNGAEMPPTSATASSISTNRAAMLRSK